MLRTPDADAALDYDRTLVLAIELSNKSWVLAAQVPGLPHTDRVDRGSADGGHRRLSRSGGSGRPRRRARDRRP
jgi:hypothetical protein